MRIFIAVARSGSFASAGQRIGMDSTTVARRVRRLETDLRATLFVRSREGLHLTAAGARLAGAGAKVEAAMDVAGEEASATLLTGTVRMSAPEGFGGSILAPAIPRLVSDQPGMRIELVASPGYLSPATREVDIAITSIAPAATGLVIEKLTDYELGLYAARSYLSRKNAPRDANDLRNHDLIGYVDDLLYSQDLKFLDAIVPNLRKNLTCSSLRVQVVIAEAGGGLCVLPRFMVEGTNLVKVLPKITITRTFWVAYHPDLYETARIKRIRRWLSKLVKTDRARLMPSLRS